MSEPLMPGRSGVPYRPAIKKMVVSQRRSSQNPVREEQLKGFRGWHQRGYLAHRDEPGLTQFVTFRLADSFPAELREEWEKLFQLEDERERRLQLEAWLDLGKGACHLKHPSMADEMAKKLRESDGTLCRMLAWVVMPNHVHVLFGVTEVPMARLVKRWKGSTGRAANNMLGRTGPFWQTDYWDTYMRDPEHQERTVRYLRNNPVKAGLVKHWKHWPWLFIRGDE